MKKIRFNRVEFVREYYTVEWTEEDYRSTLEWLSKRDDAHSIAAYGALKDLSFDDIVAILNDENYQIIITDTPGIHKPKTKLGETMVNTAFSMFSEDVTSFNNVS